MTSGRDRFVATPSQTVGPFFHFGLATEPLLGIVAPDGTPGVPIEVQVRVFDGAGDPLPDALVELWHADADGRYVDRAHGGGQDPGRGFRGWGRLATDEEGTCRFQTIRPGVAASGSGVTPAPHINLCLFARGMLRHVFTRFYFAGEPLNATDPVLQLVPEARHGTLVAHEDAVVRGRWLFDIRLQGHAETVFFDL